MSYKKYSANQQDYANYLAIRALEKLNLKSATQKQIDVIESIILEAMKSCEILLPQHHGKCLFH